MIKKFLVYGMLFFGSFLACNASEITGKWKTLIQTPEGNLDVIYVFNVDGEKLTGSARSYMGEVQINNGKVEGDEFTFDIEVGMASPLVHKGKFKDDIIRISLIMDTGGGTPDDLILTRVTDE
jgi:hypothetical protein